MTKLQTINPEPLWKAFKERQNLTDKQLEQFKTYYQMLIDTNDLHNLTAITNLSEIIKYHFEDSLALKDAIDIAKLNSIADVGSGGGFPAIPLKIVYPHLSVLLIEVSNKKVRFLLDVIDTLNLDKCDIYDLDWRTFLRKTNYALELFCARASLQPEELLRMFKPASPYKASKLIYWASKYWQPEGAEAQYITADVPYTIGLKERRLVTFELPQKRDL
jgi:16S rRNA (guanine527-N7)-methyltransferase